MSARAYSSRQKKATPTIPTALRTKTWDTTSSDLFDNLQDDVKPSRPRTGAKKPVEKSQPVVGRKSIDKGQRSSKGKSPLSDALSSNNGQLKQNQSVRSYKYSYSPLSAVNSASTNTFTTSQMKPSVKSQPSATAAVAMATTLSSNKDRRLFRKLQPAVEKASSTNDSLKIFDFDFSDDDGEQQEVGVVKSSALTNSKSSVKTSTATKQGVTKNRKASSATVVTKNGHLVKQHAKTISRTSPTVDQSDINEPVAMETNKQTEKSNKGVVRNLKRKGSYTLTSSDKNAAPSKKVRLNQGITSPAKMLSGKSSSRKAIQSTNVGTDTSNAERVPPLSGYHGDLTGNYGDTTGNRGDLNAVGNTGVHRKRKELPERGMAVSEIAKRTRSASRSGLADDGVKAEADNKESVSHTRTLMTSIIATRTRSANKNQQKITMATNTDDSPVLSGEEKTGGREITGGSQPVDDSNPSLDDVDTDVQSTSKMAPITNTRQTRSKRIVTPLSQQITSSTTSGSGGDSLPQSTAHGDRGRGVKSEGVEPGLLTESPLSTTASLVASKPNVTSLKVQSHSQDSEFIDLTDTEPLEESPDLSLSEPADGRAFNVDFDRHLVKKNPSLRKSSSYSLSSGPSSRHSPSPSKPPHSLTPSPSTSQTSTRYHQHQPLVKDVPSLTKASSWPNKQYNITNINRTPSGLVRSLFSGGTQSTSTFSGVGTVGVASGREKTGDKPLVTMVRNVRQAHECLEIGESQQFFDEVHYLLDSMRPSQPLNARCLSTCNLAIQYLDSEFSQQLRAHSFTSKITALLKDCLEHPPLCLSAAVLFYIMTRDKLNSEWNKTGTELLIKMLSMETTPTGHTHSARSAREMAKIEKKAK